MRRFIVAAAVLCLSAAPARAQGDLLQRCAVDGLSHNGVALPGAVVSQYNQLCAQVVNTFSVMQPGVGIAFSGGNPTLGTGSTLGTRLGMIPRVSASVRANIALAEMPQLFDKYSAVIGDGQSLQPMPRAGIPLGSLQADLAIGVFNGLAFGLGSVDLLGSVSMVPKINDLGMTESIMNFGGGARVGILKQGILMPGLSISGMYRKMGEMSFGDLSTHPGSFASDLSNLSLRAVASKGLLILDLAVGAGYDRYSSDVTLGWKMTCETTECRSANGGQPLALQNQVSGSIETSTWNVFANAGLSLLFLNIVGEVGYQKAADGLDSSDLGKIGLPTGQQLTNEALKGGNIFGSVGIRLSI